ncbi:DsbA family protein [Roseibium aestuarii]|uniref:DsbA family protein n=1 Tax=Roseibium aestuarii TaxID=2600299 RepID=A0ABW4JR58_9HYPH|nr:DsbA family protein [Roseibium aestuarii]
MSHLRLFTARRLRSALGGLALGAGLLGAGVFGDVAPVRAADMDRAQVETIVKEYLLANPEVIRDALAELDRRQQAAEEKARNDALSSSADILFNSEHQAVLGNPDGDVTLVEFFDYNCGYCKRAYADMVRLIEEDPKLRVVLKEFPVLGQGSAEAAQIAVAVNKLAPEKYADFHQALLLQRGQANHASAIEAATGIGLTEAQIGEVVQTELARTSISEVYELADKLGLSGTPSYVVGNEVIPGAIGYDGLKARIESVRNCGQTTC